MDPKIFILACLSITIEGAGIRLLGETEIKNFDAPQYLFAYDFQNYIQNRYSKFQVENANYEAVVNQETGVAVAPIIGQTFPVASVVGKTIVAKKIPISTVVAKTIPISTVVAKTIPISTVVAKTVPVAKLVSITPVAGKTIPSRLILKTLASASFVEKKSPVSVNDDEKIATLSAPLTYATAGYSI